jgi:hypothetical protein
MDRFIYEITEKRNYIWVYIDLGIKITRFSKTDIYQYMDKVLENRNKKKMIMLVADVKNIKYDMKNIMLIMELQNYAIENYPIKNVIIVNSNMTYQLIYRLIKGFLHKELVKKIVYLNETVLPNLDCSLTNQ